MKKNIFIIVVALSCFIFAKADKSDFIWGYRVCEKDKDSCFQYRALFRTEEDCLSYLEKDRMRCKGGKYLEEVIMESPVCWKTTSLGRAECNKL